MTMTTRQFQTLQWLADIGGTCVAWRDKVCHPNIRSFNARALERARDAGNRPAVSALHLVQRGYIEASGGQLHITELGRRVLKP